MTTREQLAALLVLAGFLLLVVGVAWAFGFAAGAIAAGVLLAALGVLIGLGS